MASDMNNETRAVPIYSENSPVRLMTEEEIRKEKTNSILPQDTISEMLKERGSRYGMYSQHAQLTQQMEDVIKSHFKYNELPTHLKETFHMIFHKIGRAVNGDPLYLDNLVDIIGYTQLSINIIKNNERF